MDAPIAPTRSITTSNNEETTSFSSSASTNFRLNWKIASDLRLILELSASRSANLLWRIKISLWVWINLPAMKKTTPAMTRPNIMLNNTLFCGQIQIAPTNTKITKKEIPAATNRVDGEKELDFGFHWLNFTSLILPDICPKFHDKGVLQSRFTSFLHYSGKNVLIYEITCQIFSSSRRPFQPGISELKGSINPPSDIRQNK